MNSRICFLVRKPHIDGLYVTLSERHQIDCIEYVGFKFPPLSTINTHKVEYTFFGCQTLMTRLGLENQLPIHIKGLQKLLLNINPEKLIVFDFYHFYFLQALWYKLRRSNGVDLFVYAETKRLPRNIISRLLLRLFIFILKANISHVNKILVYTEEGKDFLGNYIEESKIVVLPAPVDVDFFRPDLEKIYMANGVTRLLMNARFVPYKRHLDVLQAIKDLKDKGFQVKLSLIGRPGGNELAIRERVSALGLDEDISFLAPVRPDQMRDIYVEHDVLVLPSYNEAIGMVVPEAMACGIPTITSDTVGANVYVETGETGLVFKTGDVADLVFSIEKIGTREVLAKMGKNARKVIENSYSLEKITKRFEEVISSI